MNLNADTFPKSVQPLLKMFRVDFEPPRHRRIACRRLDPGPDWRAGLSFDQGLPALSVLGLFEIDGHRRRHCLYWLANRDADLIDPEVALLPYGRCGHRRVAGT